MAAEIIKLDAVRDARRESRQQQVDRHLEKLRMNIMDFITTDGLTDDPELPLPYSAEGMEYVRWLSSEFGFHRFPISQAELLGTVHFFYGLVTMATPSKFPEEEEAWHRAGVNALASGYLSWSLPVFEAYYSGDKAALARELKACNFIERAADDWTAMKAAQAQEAR